MGTTTEKLLPQNIEAEQSVLGSLLIDPEALLVAMDLLQPADFYRDAHGVIFGAALDLHRRREPVDVITLCDELARTDKLEDIGGSSYVGSLANQVPTSGNVEHYARIVARTATLRRLIHAAGQIAAVAYNEPDEQEALAAAHRALLDVERGRGYRDGFVPFGVALDEFLADLLGRMDPDADHRGVLTGYRDLDAHMLGLEPGELLYLAGRPGSGKSNIAHHIAGTGALRCEAQGAGTVHWLTLEMRNVQVAKRIVCARAGVNSRYVRAGFRRADGTSDLASYARLKAAWDELREPLNRRLRVADRGCTMAELRTRLTRAVSEEDCRLAVIDYLTLLEPEDRRQSEYQRVMDFSRDLKQIALDLGIPVLCLVQMNRGSEGRENKRPQMSDLRDAGGLEQDADWILGVYRGAMYNKPRALRDEVFRRFCEIIVIKAREGVAESTMIPLRAELEYSRLVDWPEGQDWPDDDTREGGPRFGRVSGDDAGGEEAQYA